jgi:predicted O-linked N-acetylglucosamine transferase (SPINDLY family)
MEASPLMDQKGFVRELERAYQAMWKKFYLKIKSF